MQKLDYTIVFVSDMSRSVAFYRDVLGLQIRSESPHWTECATAGCTLALHLSEEANPHTAGPTPAGCCQLGFEVRDLDAFHQMMRAKHIRCVQEPRTEPFGQIAIYADPDGLAITIMQPPG